MTNPRTARPCMARPCATHPPPLYDSSMRDPSRFRSFTDVILPLVLGQRVCPHIDPRWGCHIDNPFWTGTPFSFYIGNNTEHNGIFSVRKKEGKTKRKRGAKWGERGSKERGLRGSKRERSKRGQARRTRSDCRVQRERTVEFREAVGAAAAAAAVVVAVAAAVAVAVAVAVLSLPPPFFLSFPPCVPHRPCLPRLAVLLLSHRPPAWCATRHIKTT